MISSRLNERPTTTDPLHDDDELAQLEHATPGPWNDTVIEGFSSTKQLQDKLPTKDVRKSTAKPAKPRATSGGLPVLSQNNYISTSPRGSVRGKLSPRPRKDSSPVATAYNELVAETQAMAEARAVNMHRRQMQEQALLLGLDQLSAEHVQVEKECIRFSALKNEVDIFQQYLDPFVFEMKTPREHGVNSSVYRHFMRMQSIQDMGIPIYSLGAYEPEPNDKIMLPRTFESFYRRIRRRDAADFTDSNLITCPRPNRPKKPETESES